MDTSSKLRLGSRQFLGTCAFALLVLAAWKPVHAAGELNDYVGKADDSYAWRDVKSGKYVSGSYIEVILTSQTWRGVPWQHQLFIFRPANMDPNARQGFLYIDGGRWNDKYLDSTTELPKQARIFARLAESAHAPLAVIRQVPFQPMFDRREDALIAYTFDKYLSTGEADWPLLLPMVKSAVRAMDAVQAITRQRWQMNIERFTVAGASKRGWTSWLTAAEDPRVASIAPMVIAMLNMPAQINLQKTTFGALSEQVRDYEAINLPGRADSDAGRNLISIVDPYSYRTHLTQPKLILLGTNDAYWPLDALHLYWKDLPDPKRVLYMPNQGHSLRDVNTLIGTLAAFHRYTARGDNLPSVAWNFTSTEGRFDLSVSPDRKPRYVVAWTATSPTRDFRAAKWSHHACKRTRDSYLCTQPHKPEGFTALYSELTYKDRGEDAFALSTGVCIAAASDASTPGC